MCADGNGWEGRCTPGKVSVKNRSGSDYVERDGLVCELLSPKQKLSRWARVQREDVVFLVVVLAGLLALVSWLVYAIISKKRPTRESTSGPPPNPPPG